jgi:hypothetical protein
VEHHSRDSRQRTFGGAPWLTAKASLPLARIEAAFRRLHNDCRDKEQVTADREFHAALQPAQEVASVIESCHVEKSERKAQAYVSAALRVPQITKHTPCRANVGHTWEIESPAETATTLIAQALRQLEGKRIVGRLSRRFRPSPLRWRLGWHPSGRTRTRKIAVGKRSVNG